MYQQDKIDEYEKQIERSKSNAVKCLDRSDYDKAVSYIMKAAAAQETQRLLLVLNGQGAFKED